MSKLPSTQNTRAVNSRVSAAARAILNTHKRLTAAFEHGHWWVTCSQCGAQWDAVDAHGGRAVNGFDFEQVTEGEEDHCQ